MSACMIKAVTLWPKWVVNNRYIFLNDVCMNADCVQHVINKEMSNPVTAYTVYTRSLGKIAHKMINNYFHTDIM